MRSRSPSPSLDKSIIPTTASNSRSRHRSPSPTANVSSRINNQHDTLAGKVRELNVLGTILLQLCYLNAKIQACFSEQELEAMKQLYRGWTLLQRRKKKLKENQFSLEQERTVQRIHHVLTKQAPIFDKLITHMATFQQYYHTLATALESTTHRLPTSGIAVDSFQQTETNLCNTLQHSQTLLQNMQDHLQVFAHRIDDIHTTFQKLHTIVTDSDRQVQECQENLVELRLTGEEEHSLMANSEQQIRKQRQLSSIVSTAGHDNGQQLHEITLVQALGLLDV